MLFDLLGGIQDRLRRGTAGPQPARTDGGQVAGQSTVDGAMTVEPVADDGHESDDGQESDDGHTFDVTGQVLLSGIPQAAFVIDTEGAIRAWNHDMATLTGGRRRGGTRAR
jgi:methyl-accepting chemotaxis protein